MKKSLYSIIFSISLLGCAPHHIHQSITEYKASAPAIQLGDSETKVVDILEPTQAALLPYERKLSEQFLKDETQVKIHFFRSTLQDDGITTDDEFTPYVFHDGNLVGIGWEALGGPKTQGQSRPEIHVNQSSFYHHHFGRY